MRRHAALALALASATACLDAPDEEIPLANQVGPAGFDIAAATPLSRAGLDNYDPSLATTSVTRLQGFADGRGVNYWNVDGELSTIIAPFYEVLDTNGERAHPVVIDVVPGDAGYTPFWRRVVVRATERYAGEVLWSREAIDAAVQAGLVEVPEPTEQVYNCPVLTSTTVALPGVLPGADVPKLGQVYYRGYSVPWVDFGRPIEVPVDRRDMPIRPVYLLQRINEGALIYEFATGVDIDGDDALTQSNNIFAVGIDSDRYTPLWNAWLVRVTRDFPSVETSTDAAGLKGATEFLDANGNVISAFVVGTPVSLGLLVNCPIRDDNGGN